MRRNGSLKINGSNLAQNHKWVKSQPKMVVTSQKWSRTSERVETRVRRGSRPLLTTPEREPWSRQNLMKRQNDPNQQLVHHHHNEKADVGDSKRPGGCGILIVRGILLVLHTLYWVSTYHNIFHLLIQKCKKPKQQKCKNNYFKKNAKLTCVDLMNRSQI